MLEAVDRPRSYFERGAGTTPPWPGRWVPRPSESPVQPSCRGVASGRSGARAYLIEAFTARDDLSPVMARIRAHVHSAFRIQTGL